MLPTIRRSIGIVGDFESRWATSQTEGLPRFASRFTASALDHGKVRIQVRCGLTAFAQRGHHITHSATAEASEFPVLARRLIAKTITPIAKEIRGVAHFASHCEYAKGISSQAKPACSN